MDNSNVNKEDWKELDAQGVKKFKEILGIIDRFRSISIKTENTKDSPWKFKRDLLKSENVRVFVQPTIDDHVFLIRCEIYGEGKTRSDEWAHVDGIQEARDVFREAGILSHPVFEIVCLSDLYRGTENIS
ncbi:LIC_13246 family protein [Leptospira borgpetersenii]|uniref:Uncharacterized protein n=1 Tax=Leptospira borgpetersenii serovar Ballum TaxID=280505 RepID=A0A0E3B0J2_LEPBO|nr:hypothetical protein [Leptospira borgpetersenii]EMO07903.1 hypothetical protein LEP1GSC137_1691 [Leptospira borgpetersenii str. Noumea 25]ALO25287.1 hypothetical protein LBBP_00973 [Leptospira borgpetersenii serovar Ballum]ANH00239.1 Uncharacterized protein LB4E_0774 [Leptospira borgpetersenii str. 4E]EKQ98610.1 hypothetical protein LEP1GSC121_3305 [Leptospira borgpetersenii serovar Castellonis str. 200801910]KGE22853.1 hypothetical protein IQ66_14275 [Leptospira borgpetersenii serovar Ball